MYLCKQPHSGLFVALSLGQSVKLVLTPSLARVNLIFCGKKLYSSIFVFQLIQAEQFPLKLFKDL